MWNVYLTPNDLEEALDLLHEHRDGARLIAGGTDVIVDVNRGLTIPEILIDLTGIAGLDSMSLRDDKIHLGPLVTHNEVVDSDLCRGRATALAEACFEIGAPQIRNRGTVAGNVASASPANDSITALVALDAEVTVQSVGGQRRFPVADFVTGPGSTVMASNEIIVDIAVPAMPSGVRSAFIKCGLRGAQAIAVVNVAAVIGVDERDQTVTSASLAFGSVGPTIMSTPDAAASLIGQRLDSDSIAVAGDLVRAAVRPIDDFRGSAPYRRYMAGVVTGQVLRRIADSGDDSIPARPVLLRTGESGKDDRMRESLRHTVDDGEAIDVTINKNAVSVAGANDKTLSQLLRDVVGLTGTKEACCEGECGACTVIVDGVAAMSCLIPAPQVHGSSVTTIEGLAGADGRLHPVQQAFIDKGAAQCGFCTPGFIVGGAVLTDEVAAPTRDDVSQAMAGNLCRCTTYYPIVAALEAVAEPVNAGDG